MGISSIMTWAKTELIKTKKEVVKEEGENEGEQKNEENSQKGSDEEDGGENAENKEGEGDKLDAIEEEDEKKDTERPKTPEPEWIIHPFTEKDYELRIPSENYKLHKELEDLALSV